MIARVTLDLPVKKEFDYAVPDELKGAIVVGSRVKVPFHKRQLLGTVTALLDQQQSPERPLRPILKITGSDSPVTAPILKLARWIAQYYCCPLELALKSALPEAVRKEEQGWRERLVIERVERLGEVPDLTTRQKQILHSLDPERPVPLQKFLEIASTTAATLRRLEDKGLVRIRAQISERDPYGKEQILPSQSLVLNPEQQAALSKIINALDTLNASTTIRNPRVFLLHGVTGSGKTEVYLQSIAHTLSHGKCAIVLVPEISLTPQTVERFKARFSGGKTPTTVAVLHSHLSTGERHDEWQKIRQGRARIVIGARSAIFAPAHPLGLIIVDEEHEHSYKQEESPRYHARDVAVMRGQLENAVVVLGSATPSMESYYNVQRGKYSLLEMLTRADDKQMPFVRVVDMRHEFRAAKGIPILSRMLKEAIQQRLERGEQTILFLNRRGYASSLQCPQCGFVAGCPNCSVALTYHRQLQKICCHICGHSENAPAVCPTCGHAAIRFAGVGTEKVEETLTKVFPKARLARMDSDALKRKDDYRRILGDFRTGRIDILVGTQMIAKGLHFPNVTLVGIIYADLSLHIPDFRAGERTFQLLTQVAGRAGRGDVEGEVFVQAFTPFHPAIQHARRHDFEGFYEQEMEFRQQLKYPPLSRIALLTLKGRNEQKVQFSADYLKSELAKTFADWKDLILAGPAPAPLLKAETFYRYQIMARTPKMSRFSTELAGLLPRIHLPEDVTWSVDIDPTNLC